MLIEPLLPTRARSFISLGLTCLIAWSLAHLTLTLGFPLVDATTVGRAATLPASVVTPEVSETERSELAAVARLSLFGVKRVAEVRENLLRDAPETRLNLVLHGVVAGQGSGQASGDFALIGEAGKPPTWYRPGDDLPGNALLVGVFADRVILLRNGSHESLQLPRQPLGLEPPPSARDLSGLNPIGSSREADREVRLSAPDVSRLRDPAYLLEQIDVNVVKRGPGFGLVLKPAGDRALFNRLGLVAGDVLLEIEGTPIGDFNSPQDVITRLSDRQQLDLTLERRGSIERLRLSQQP